MSEPPSEALRAALGVRVVSSLGGRVNQHWLVEASGGRQVLRRWAPQPVGSIEYERRLTARLGAMEWPVADLEEPVEEDGDFWSLMTFLPGEPGSYDPHEGRARGRLLAALHADTARIEGLGQRPGWRRCEAILGDPELDRVLSANEAERTEEVRIVRWHLDRARQRVEDLRLGERSGIPIHGDFAPWNLLFEEGRLSGLLDFELAHEDHRVGDFVLAWRGKYDEVIRGYDEVSPLEAEEWAAIVPVYWAQLIEDACRDLRFGRQDGGWTIGKLMTRSAIMGPDAEERP